MNALTTAQDLCNRVAELLACTVSMQACREEMHRLGWTRYESLTAEQVGEIADAVAERLRPQGTDDCPFDVIDGDGKITPREDLE